MSNINNQIESSSSSSSSSNNNSPKNENILPTPQPGETVLNVSTTQTSQNENIKRLPDYQKLSPAERDEFAELYKAIIQGSRQDIPMIPIEGSKNGKFLQNNFFY